MCFFLTYWVFAGQSFWVKTLLQSFVSQLLLLSFLQLLQVVVLTFLSFFQIVLFGFQLDDGFPQFGGLDTHSLSAQAVDFQRLDAERQGDLLFFFQLFLGLVAFNSSATSSELRSESVRFGNNVLGNKKLTPSFFWMVKFGPLRSLSLTAWSIAWRFFSASSRRCLFSSMSRCFFSSTSRWRRSSSSFLRWAMRCSSSARDTLRLDCFSLSFLSSSSSFERCLRHSKMYSFNCSSRSDLFWSWRLMNSGSSPLQSVINK